jgi:hypothetical protein
MCDVAVSIKCPNYPDGACMTDCRRMETMPVCADEMRALQRCAATRPAADYACDESGAAALREGVCAGEDQRASDCVDRMLAQAHAGGDQQPGK